MLVLWLLVAVSALLWFVRRLRTTQEPPEYPGAFPLIGHIPFLFGDSSHLLSVFQEASHHCLKTGDATTVHFGFHTDYSTEAYYYTCTAHAHSDKREAAKLYIPRDFANTPLTAANACLEKNFMYNFAKSWLGDGLITSTLPIWKKHRKLLNPTFSQHLMYSYTDVFNRQARRLVGQLARHSNRGDFDHLPVMHQNALETICMTAMGLDLTGDTVIDSSYINAVDEILTVLQKRFKTPWLYFDFTFQLSALKKKQDKSIEILHNVSSQVIRKWKLENKKKSTCDRIATDNVSEPKSKPFIELLFEMSEGQGLFTDDQVRKHVDTIIVSGYETIASVLCFTLILIGSYPRVQERILTELNDVFDATDRDVTRHDLSRLVYLEAVIKESMRVYTVAPIVARRVDRDVKLKKSTLLAGNICILSLYGIHRHSMWGEDVEEFRPERWLHPSTLPDNANTFLAFGLGRRNCIGKTYAMTSLKTTLVHLLQHYIVSADHKKMVLKLEFLLKPLSGHHISIEKRVRV